MKHNVISRQALLEGLEPDPDSRQKEFCRRLAQALTGGEEEQDEEVQAPQACTPFAPGEAQAIAAYDPNRQRCQLEEVQLDEELLQLMSNHHRLYSIEVSDQLLEEPWVGEACGPGCEKSGLYYLMFRNDDLAWQVEGHVCLMVTPDLYRAILAARPAFEGYDMFGTRLEEGWIFRRCDEGMSIMDLRSFGMIRNLYSRNTGLLESGSMLKKYALIVGAGSVGSHAALELATAGVGEFLLVDGDVLKLHNVCRHQLGIRDLGRFKVDALKEAILNINPQAQVQVHNGYLDSMPKELLEKLKGRQGVVIGTADNRSGNAQANELAGELGVPFAAIGCWNRAHAGEVFYWIPGKDMPTYGQAFAGLLSADRPEAHSAYFASDGDAEHLRFEPGIRMDIDFVSLVGEKIVMDLLNLGDPSYTSRLLEEYTHYTLICNNNKPELGGENAAIFPYPLFISRNVHLKNEEAEHEGHGAAVS